MQGPFCIRCENKEFDPDTAGVKWEKDYLCYRCCRYILLCKFKTAKDAKDSATKCEFCYKIDTQGTMQRDGRKMTICVGCYSKLPS